MSVIRERLQTAHSLRSAWPRTTPVVAKLVETMARLLSATRSSAPTSAKGTVLLDIDLLNPYSCTRYARVCLVPWLDTNLAAKPRSWAAMLSGALQRASPVAASTSEAPARSPTHAIHLRPLLCPRRLQLLATDDRLCINLAAEHHRPQRHSVSKLSTRLQLRLTELVVAFVRVRPRLRLPSPASSVQVNLPWTLCFKSSS
jgi:hypothetical protein